MSKPSDPWDAEERDAFTGLENELAELRRRHRDDPSVAILRAAGADALPPELQERVARHLRDSAWSQALIQGLRETGVDDRLDRASEDRLFDRIARDVPPAASAAAGRRWSPAMLFGGLAVAATLLVAVVISRPRPETVPGTAATSSEEPSSRAASTPVAPPTPALRIAYEKPAVKLSTSALTWRGEGSANPFLRDLTPALDAYRAGDYPRADALFERLAKVYPRAVEVPFYQGVSRMLAGNDAGAIAPLEAAARLGDASFAGDAAWFLAVARQRAGRPGARAGFVEVCRGTSAYAAAACAAVAQLDAPSNGARQR